MKHEHQSENVSWFSSRRGVVLIRLSGDHWLLPFHRTPIAPVWHSCLSTSAGVPVYALLHAWRHGKLGNGGESHH
jgi:hypothetical protein